MKILCLSAHADDAEIGCGGSIAKFTEEGNDVYSAVFSMAEKSLPKELPKDTLLHEARASAHILGIKPQNLLTYRYPVREFPKFRQEILEDLVKLNKKIQPDLVLLPSKYDFHQDHQTVTEEGFRAFRFISILGYEMFRNCGTFEATFFIILKKRHIQKKNDALNCYESQKLRMEQSGRKHIDQENIKALAQIRGTQIGVDYAEAFNTVRWIMG